MAYRTFLAVGDVVFKKRTYFYDTAPKKVQMKLQVAAYKISKKIGKNLFLITDFESNQQHISAGDHLVRSNHSKRYPLKK